MINYGKHYLDKKDISAVNNVLKNKFITQGKEIEKFEKSLSNYFGCQYTLAVSSGTSALNIVSKILNWKKDDIIFCSPITFVASSNCILQQNASPFFIDINSNSFNIDIELLKKQLENKNISKKAKAIIATDFGGNPCDWYNLKKISKKHNLILINDNCHALGSSINSDKKYAVKYADIVTHSYHAVKNITTGEGGSILTNNKEFYNKAKVLRSHGVIKNINSSEPWNYDMIQLGSNNRITDIQAALGNSQLKKLNKFIKFRQKIAKIYDEKFSDTRYFLKQKIASRNKSSYHLYPLLINFKKLKKKRSDLFTYLKKKKIYLQVHYKPIYKFKYYRNMKNFKKFYLKKAEIFYSQEVSLPIYYGLSKKKQVRVINHIKKFLNIKNRH
jgi:dTDP-4-amino-4,6-dideoxygalactose transaminase